MTRRARFSKYSRRTSSGGGRGGRILIIIAAVLAFVILSVTVSVIFGYALGGMAEKYGDSLPALDISVEERYSGDKRVRTVNARAYQWGYGVSYYISEGIRDFSVCLRDADGFITYHSDVDVSFGTETDMGSRALTDALLPIHEADGYACGYFYSGAFSEKDEYLREIKKSYEIALIKEAASGGVDDILILGLELENCDIAELEEFISRASIAAGGSVLGVAVDEEDVRAEQKEDFRVRRIAAVCDYLALDLRKLPKSAGSAGAGDEPSKLHSTLDELKYYVRVYSMRLIFSSENSGLCDSAMKWGVTSLQVVE